METSALFDNYNLLAPKAARLRDSITSELAHLLTQKGVTLGVPIEARVKEWSSIEEKLTRKSVSLNSIKDLDDLVGIRLILLFRCDLATVDALLREALTILSVEDTSLRLAETQFGYQSQHYVVEIPQSWLKIPSFVQLGGIRIEIQVRTLAQHIWAAASHKLQYKHEASVPMQLRRSIHRASALLETIDIEFDRLLEERSKYIENQLSIEDPNKPINVDILSSLLTELLPAQNRSGTENFNDLLLDLNHFGVTTASKLSLMLTRHLKTVIDQDKKAGNAQKTHYYSHVGLVRQALRKEFSSSAVDNYSDIKRKIARN
jgi:putative GTP pyrophosphokinase